MLLPNFIRTLSLVILLPAAGIGVAATTMIQEQANPDDTSPYVNPLLDSFDAIPPQTDGRQDSSRYSHLVEINPDGSIRGHITDGQNGVPAMRIQLFQDQTVVQAVDADDDGYFVLTDIQPGVYSLYGEGGDVIVAHGFYAVNTAPKLAGGPVASGNNDVQIQTMATVASDLEEINRIRRHYLPVVQLLPEEDNNENNYAKAMRQSFLVSTPSLPIDIQAVAQESENKPLSAGLAPTSVTISSGVLEGELSQIFGEVIDFRHIHCFLINDGKLMAEVAADADGKFQITGLKEGKYSFVAAGTGGFAALQVELVDAGSVQNNAGDGFQFVSTATPALRSLNVLSVALAMQEAGAPMESVSGIASDDGGDLGGGFDLGGGNGAGGGGGGGGAGGALTWAALGMGAAAIAVAGTNDTEVLASPFIFQ